MNLITEKSRLLRILGILALLAIAIIVLAASWEHRRDHAHAPSHSHEHAQHTEASLALNDGKKWSTDGALRQGMEQIRVQLKQIQGDEQGSLDAIQANRVALQIVSHVQAIIAQCKLEPKADAMLHLLITDLMLGAEALKKPETRQAGLGQIAHALTQYPKYFDHPDW